MTGEARTGSVRTQARSFSEPEVRVALQRPLEVTDSKRPGLFRPSFTAGSLLDECRRVRTRGCSFVAAAEILAFRQA